MKLHNCGVTVEVTNPLDIARFMKVGYVEVKEETKEESKPEKSSDKTEDKKGKKA